MAEHKYGEIVDDLIVGYDGVAYTLEEIAYEWAEHRGRTIGIESVSDALRDMAADYFKQGQDREAQDIRALAKNVLGMAEKPRAQAAGLYQLHAKLKAELGRKSS